MRRNWIYAVIFLCVPIGILVTAAVRRGPVYNGKPALVWFGEMQMLQQSPGLDALKKLGKSAVPTLQAELESRKIGYRMKAAWALGQLGPVAGNAVPNLILALDDNDKMVRDTAIRSLSDIGIYPDNLIPKLVGKLDDEFVVASADAADLLKKVEEDRRAKNLPWVTNEYDYAMAFLHSRSVPVRLTGLERLLNHAQSDARYDATVKALLNDTNIHIRYRTEAFLKKQASIQKDRASKTSNALPK